MLGKVWVPAVSCGYGHVRTAQVLVEELKRAGCCKEVRYIDVLEYANPLLRGVHHDAYTRLVKELPHLVAMSFDRSDKPGGNEGISLLLDKAMTLPFRRLLRKEQPDLLVCTHFLPARIATGLRKKGRIKSRIVTVVTDYYAHSMWRTRNLDHYFVPSRRVATNFKSHQIDGSRITESGIPISAEFSVQKEKAAVRAKHGLDPELPAVLITAGGQGLFSMADLIDAIARVQHPVQAVVVCGKSAETKAIADKTVAELDPAVARRIKVLGFTTEMDELMAACDILVGKPGGLTTSEALARGIAFAAFGPIPGQEERNADLLLQSGAGIRCYSFRDLIGELNELLADPRRIEQMQRAAREIAKPNAAQTVVAKLREMYDR